MTVYVTFPKTLPIALAIGDASVDEVRDAVREWIDDGLVNTLNFGEGANTALVVNWRLMAHVLVSDHDPTDPIPGHEGEPRPEPPVLYPMNLHG